MRGINPDLFTFHMDIQIRWFDLDPFQHVNNSVYFQYFEIARTRYMPKASNDWNWNVYRFLLARTSCDFMKELTLDDINPKVWARVSRLGSKSFDLEYMITSNTAASDLVIHSVGSSVQVMVDAKEKDTIRIPDWLRAEFRDFEKPKTIDE